ncbi:MAG: DUF2027 domain-containing protein [Bacteroidales bacterium]|jgi:hypothetical protein|nr:DUF2027 domain-containing protein [Bacteroidales bacterium]
MKYNIGDRVRFLTEKGGGVIVKINNSNIVTVRTDDDFDIPYHIKDLVKIEQQGSVGDFFNTEKDKKVIEKKAAAISEKTKIEEQYFDERHSKIIKYKNRNAIPEGIYLGWSPQDQKLLVSGYLDLYLINDTHYDILFSLFLQNQNGVYTGADYDAIPAHQKVLLTSFDRDKLEKWTKGIVQILLHSDKASSVMTPVSASFKITPARFYKEDNYVDYSFLEGKTFVFELCKSTAFKPLNVRDEKEEVVETFSILKTFAQQSIPEAFIKKHQTSPHEAVVDLHIESLTDNYQKMSDSEKFNYQVRYFQKCIDSAIINKIPKIIFIHGVGQGVLRKAILEVLEDYPNITIHDAPMRQFGVGAIETHIRS